MTKKCSIVIMVKILCWRDICPRGESLHIASLATARQKMPGLHAHDFFECFLIESGTGQHYRPHGVERLNAHELYFVSPQHAHAVGAARGEQLEFLNLAIAAPIFHAAKKCLPRLGDLWDDKKIRSCKLAIFSSERLRALALEAAGGTHDEVDAVFLLSGLVRIVTGDSSRPTGTNLPDWLREALPLADDSEALREGLPALLRLCGRSREHVNRVFKKCLGTTPTAWIAASRVKRAACLLRTTQLSVLDICLECGFESPSYFHRIFREAFGTTPLKYRAEGDRFSC